ncbi:acyloxyacyl hydrolase [Shivajiella indica]|uniref:Acyloxyacyl hydrolase n=1 Tax=Shivajiella indica TaxID=872115 RepID=A0ABW5BE50_9BACT
MKKILFLIPFFMLQCCLFGQNIKRLGLEGSYGFIIPHSRELKPLSQTNPLGINLHYQNLNSSLKNWKNCNCFHYMGLQISYHNFGNPEVLGSATSLTGTFEPIIWQKNKWTFSLLSGLGLSYLNRIYDEVSNPENVFFSSHLSFLIYLTPKIEYSLTQDWGLNASISYNHISNGGQSQPNKGINYPMGSLGLVRYFQRKIFPIYEKDKISRNWMYYFESGFSTREGKDGREPNISVVFGTIKPLSSINGIGGGLELNKDFSLEVNENRIEALIPAPYIAHHFIFGKIDFSQRMAFYTHKPMGYNDYVLYQRYVLGYKLLNHLTLGIGLKAHGHIAEHMDLRIGWKF